MEAPQAPGNYISFFRFVHGDNNRFGQKVWCDILVKAAPAQLPQVFPAEIKPVESKPDLEDQSAFAEVPVVPQQQIDLEFIDVAPENKLEEPAKELAVSHFEDREGSSLLEEVKEEVKEEEVPVKSPAKIEE